MMLPSPRRVLVARFWQKVSMTGNVCECWTWSRAKDPNGYGRVDTRVSLSGTGLAHRAAYEITFGNVPGGLQLDHLCRNTSCVNPWHLEPVTNAENGRRGIAVEVTRARHAAKTHCPHGHPYDEANTYHRKSKPNRCCRACAREGWHRRKAK